MKKSIIVIFISLMAFNSNAQKKKTYWENGKLQSIYFLKDGKPNGIYKVYHSDGQLAETGQYSNGKKIGVWTSYEEDGEIWISRRYSGEEETFHIEYFENNKKKEKGHYDINGKATGEWADYYESGGLKSIYHYLKGFKVREYTINPLCIIIKLKKLSIFL